MFPMLISMIQGMKGRSQQRRAEQEQERQQHVVAGKEAAKPMGAPPSAATAPTAADPHMAALEMPEDDEALYQPLRGSR